MFSALPAPAPEVGLEALFPGRSGDLDALLSEYSRLPSVNLDNAKLQDELTIDSLFEAFPSVFEGRPQMEQARWWDAPFGEESPTHQPTTTTIKVEINSDGGQNSEGISQPPIAKLPLRKTKPVRVRIREKDRLQALTLELREKSAKLRELQQLNERLKLQESVLQSAVHEGDALLTTAGKMSQEGDSYRTKPAALTRNISLTKEQLRVLNPEHIRAEVSSCIKLASEVLLDPNPANLEKIAHIFQNSTNFMHSVFLMNPTFVYMMESMNLATGKQEQPPSDHWHNALAAVGLDTDQVKHLSVCFDTYEEAFNTVMASRAKLCQKLPRGPVDPMDADEAVELTHQLTSNMRKETVLYCMLTMTMLKALKPLQLATLLVHAYPYKPSTFGIARAFCEKQMRTFPSISQIS